MKMIELFDYSKKNPDELDLMAKPIAVLISDYPFQFAQSRVGLSCITQSTVQG